MKALSALWRPLDAEAVVREHGPAVYRQLKRIFGPRADVDDVYQLVFVEVLRSLPRFLGKSRLSTWIRRITWNVAYQEMRLAYRARQGDSFDELLPEVGSSPEISPEERQVIERLYGALAELEPKQRQAVLMHDVEGCTLKEIAEATGRPLQTVASQLQVARHKLAERLRRLSAEPTSIGQEPGETARKKEVEP